MRNILLRSALALLCPLLANAAPAANYFPAPDSAGGWRPATNASEMRERAGMDSRKLDQAWDFTQRCTQNGGLLVVPSLDLVIYKMGGDDGLRRVLEMVSAAVMD